MVGIHILKHRYNVSDEQAVESLQENAYWQCFWGYLSFQKGPLVEATSLVKFRNRIGPKGLEAIETVLHQAWQSLGLVKTKRVSLDTTAQPKHIAYPTDADLLHRVREQIVKDVKRARREVALRKPFRSFSRTSKKVLLQIKKFQRKVCIPRPSGRSFHGDPATHSTRIRPLIPWPSGHPGRKEIATRDNP